MSSLISGITSQDTKEVCLLPAALNGGNAYQTVYTVLGTEIAIGIFPADLNGNRFDTCFITVQIVKDFYLKALFLSPTAVHTVQHAAPVTGLCSACTCIQT